MRFYFLMPKGLRAAFEAELREFNKFETPGEMLQAWKHLERAHIIGQRWAIEHTMVHWEMLKFGFRIKDSKEVIGQIPRLIFGGVKSFVGKIPVGNTGGANVPPLRPMEIPEDIKMLMEPYVEC